MGRSEVKIDERAARLLYNNQTEIRMTENEFVDAFLAKDGLLVGQQVASNKIAWHYCGLKVVFSEGARPNAH